MEAFGVGYSPSGVSFESDCTADFISCPCTSFAWSWAASGRSCLRRSQTSGQRRSAGDGNAVAADTAADDSFVAGRFGNHVWCRDWQGSVWRNGQELSQSRVGWQSVPVFRLPGGEFGRPRLDGRRRIQRRHALGAMATADVQTGMDTLASISVPWGTISVTGGMRFLVGSRVRWAKRRPSPA